jgi:hypothetical protein
MVFNVFYYMFRPLHHNQVYQITAMTVISAIEIVVINVPQKLVVIYTLDDSQKAGTCGIHSFSILSDDRSKASSKTIPPHSAI